MDNEKMKLIQDKFAEFQNNLAKEFGVVLQPTLNIVQVKQQEEKKVEEDNKTE